MIYAARATNSLLLITLTATLCLCPLRAPGQVTTNMSYGILPEGSYSSHSVDAVNMDNGVGVINIPLLSLPQRGILRLSFGISGNSASWQPTLTCTFDQYVGGNDCDYSYTANNGTGIGMNVVENQNIRPLENPVTTQNCYLDQGLTACQGYFTNEYSIIDPDGAQHRLYIDSTDTSRWRTTDGSGYLYHPGYPDADYKSGPSSGSVWTIVDETGVKYSGGSSDFDPLTLSDPDGNSITPNGPSGILDSIGRTIPLPPVASTNQGDLSKCPNISASFISASFQPAASESDWVLPAAGGTATYRLCYSKIQLRTNFFGEGQSYVDQNGDGTTTGYIESDEQTYVLQSVVLPDGRYWGFWYDAADPSNSSSFGYGLLKGIHYPLGGSISYQYAIVNPCYVGNLGVELSYGISQRTTDDGIGHQQTWTYNYGTPAGNIETDPNLNDTVYSFQSPTQDTSPCEHHEISRKIYRGSYSAGTLLSTKTTQYQTVLELSPPWNNAWPGTSNDLPSKVTTTLDDTTQSSVMKGYDQGTFSATVRGCSPDSQGNCQMWETGTQSISLGIPASSTVTEYSGAVLSSSNTQYLWQTNSSYLGANILGTPTTVTTYDGATPPHMVARTSTNYDEPTYICNASGTYGHPTTVSELNNLGQVHSGWNCNGMLSQKIDGNGSATTINYEATGIFPEAISQPKILGVSHVDQYTWDMNTGNMLTHIDQNNITTKYTYNDSLGRLTLSQRAADTPAETDTSYSYPNVAESDTAADLRAKGDGLLKTKTLYDGLGRSIMTESVTGTVIRSAYDYFGEPCAVSNPTYSDPGNISCTASQNPAQTGTDGITYYTRDPLKREIMQTNQDSGTDSWARSGNVITFTDENANQWNQTVDVLSRLTQVGEPDGAKTFYTYDALGNLTCAAQDGGAGGTFSSCQSVPTSWRPRTFGYDALSQMTSSSNPEDGGISYTYDLNGNVHTKTDARGVMITYAYDALNRVTGKTYPSGSTTPSSCYEYDAVPNGMSGIVSNPIGRLTAEWTQIAACPSSGQLPSSGTLTSRVMGYDALGRIIKEQQCIASCSTPFSFSYNYDLAGNVTNANNGVGTISWQPTFDSGARLSTVIALPAWTGPEFSRNLFAVKPTGYSAVGLTDWTVGDIIPGVNRSSLTFHNAYDNRLRPTQETVIGNQ